ncbi:hypothetical protein [Streptomyces luteolus]|uniref:S1 motif domain-containing protein n=1 Tax=Streptomyces luteolus TaxID=3043615 RepID=A0ABT6SP85_9ACTN|nr:hypothetical protein [Streptomyces sp. B-S-A12]MDI3417419.1 hypothetical protein [Streptomyces sp. B-S-A12]
MPNWTQHHDASTATHHWYECDDSGAVLRQASFSTGTARTEPPPYLAEHAPREEPFAGSDGAAVTAADRSELAWLREEFGPLCVEVYEATYGTPAGASPRPPHPDAPAPDGRPVTAAEFERAWRRARRDRDFATVTTGPLPVGLRLSGTVELLPWGAGVTGLFVGLGLPVLGFVDMGHLPREPGLWPSVGTVGEFEVVGVRLNCAAESRSQPQVRLRPRPAAAPGPAAPSPRPGRP